MPEETIPIAMLIFINWEKINPLQPGLRDFYEVVQVFVGSTSESDVIKQAWGHLKSTSLDKDHLPLNLDQWRVIANDAANRIAMKRKWGKSSR